MNFWVDFVNNLLFGNGVDYTVLLLQFFHYY